VNTSAQDEDNSASFGLLQRTAPPPAREAAGVAFGPMFRPSSQLRRLPASPARALPSAAQGEGTQPSEQDLWASAQIQFRKNAVGRR